MDVAIQLYVKSKSVNDFFLLHGITGILLVLYSNFCIIYLTLSYLKPSYIALIHF